MALPAVADGAGSSWECEDVSNNDRATTDTADLIEALTYLSDVHIFPRNLALNSWLKNFSSDEHSVALELASALLYLSDDEFKKSLNSGVKSAIASIVFGQPMSGRVSGAWEAARRNTLFSTPTDGSDDPTNSGNMCLRYLKQMGIPEKSVLVGGLRRRVEDTPTPIELILVDDLTASGNQFCKFWGMKQVRGDTSGVSFADLLADGKIGRAIYVPVLATDVALERIEAECPGIEVMPVNILSREYMIAADECTLIRQPALQKVRNLATKYAPAVQSNHGDFGYGELGLTLSFEHGTPNNTVPILGHNRDHSMSQTWHYLLEN